jgi:putative ABC transport system permease protein
MSPDEARREAERRFGWISRIKEDAYEVRGGGWMESLVRDVAYGLRMLRKSPGHTLTAVLILGLSIGANSAIFSVVNAVLLRRLPYRDPQQLVQVWETNPRANRWGQWASYPDFLDWRDQNRVFDNIAAFRPWMWKITGGDHPEVLRGFLVTANIFSLLHVEPMFGRPFRPGEDETGRNAVVILGYGLWQRRFGSDPGLLGQSVSLDGEKYSVIGIMPPTFDFPRDIGAPDIPDIWLPLGAHPERRDRGSHNFRVLGRLKADVTIEQAQANMESIARSIGEQHPDHRGRSALVAGLQRNATREVRPALLLVFGAVGFVLLIACTNVANLQLARATTRQRETAVRQALGASRARLIRQLLTENLLIALLGGTVGLALAIWGIRVLVKLGPAIPRLQQTTIDPTTLSFTLLISLAAGILFGLAPAFQGSRADINERLKEATAGSTTSSAKIHTRNLLVVAEMALTVMVLIAATLVIRSFLLLQNVDPGFSPQSVLTAYVGSSEKDPSRQVALFREIVEQLETLPGVEAVGASSAMPLRGNDNGPFRTEGQTSSQPEEAVVYAERPKVTPNYLHAMGIPLVKGREFTWADDNHALLVAVVSEALVRQYWPHDDPIGKRLSIDSQNGKPIWRQIVGVVKDTKHDDLAEQVRPVIYVPLAQLPQSFMILAVRTHGPPADLTSAVRRAVMSVHPDQPLFRIETMEQVISDSLSGRRFQTLLLGMFGALALTLAVVGVYAVMSFSVSERKRETVIRIALGAQRSQMLANVLRHGLMLALAGTVIGIASALLLSRTLSGMLYGVTATDPVTFIVIPFMVVAVALAACYLPAWRAVRVDPMSALRCE